IALHVRVGDVGVPAAAGTGIVHVLRTVAVHHHVQGIGFAPTDLDPHALRAGEVVVLELDVTALGMVVVEVQVDGLPGVIEVDAGNRRLVETPARDDVGGNLVKLVVHDRRRTRVVEIDCPAAALEDGILNRDAGGAADVDGAASKGETAEGRVAAHGQAAIQGDAATRFQRDVSRHHKAGHIIGAGRNSDGGTRRSRLHETLN